MNTGKRRSAFITAAVLLLLLLLPGCGAAASEESFHALVPSFPPLQETEGLRIAVASDLHFNPDRRRDGEEASADLYNAELIDALLWDVQQQGATVLLLTGDLCNGGKAQRHTALAEKLKQAEADGLSVFVLPGNHDLAPITQAEFAEFYADFY